MPANKQTQPPEGAPGINRSGAGAVIQLCPEEEVMVNEYALKYGIPRAEALKKLLFFANAAKEQAPPPKPTLLTRSMQVIQDAKDIGMAGNDPNDALNVMGRSVAIQTLGKQLLGGDKVPGGDKVTIEDIKEMMYLKIMGNMAGGGGDSDVSKVVQEMREENKATREFYEKRIDDMEQKMHDMVFEKRIQTMQETQDQGLANIEAELQELSNTVATYRNAPANASPEQKQDAISRLKSASNEIKEIKNALTELGIIPQAGAAVTHTGEPGKEVWRNPDGSTNKIMYFLDRLTGAAEKGIDAWQKKTPDFEKIEQPAGHALTASSTQNADELNITITDRITPEDYFALLMTKTSLSPEEQHWLNANAHRFVPKRLMQAGSETPAKPAQQENQVLCSKCAKPEIFKEGLCQSCWNTANQVPQ